MLNQVTEYNLIESGDKIDVQKLVQILQSMTNVINQQEDEIQRIKNHLNFSG